MFSISTLTASGTGYIELSRPVQVEGISQHEVVKSVTMSCCVATPNSHYLEEIELQN